MNHSPRLPRPVHELKFEGMAPWPVPGILDMSDVTANPAARCCVECGRMLLLLLLQSSTWVSHRTEHVCFRDDRSVMRRVTVEFHVPTSAPVFRGDDGQPYSLLPLSVMRRKTLVNFELRDEAGRSVVMPSLRQNQAITESMLLACAEAALDGSAGAAGVSQEIVRFVHEVVSGDQEKLSAAFRTLDPPTAAPAVLCVYDQPIFKAMLNRMADNFVLWVMIPADAPRRRTLVFCCDEPLQLSYRESGYNGETYELGKKLGPWHPSAWCSALGLTTTRIRFPIPAAENAASFHFEIDAPKGVQIAEASLLAGRPGEHDGPPPYDHVQGGYPTVALHVIEVPNGSLARAQIGLQVVTRGWVMASTLASWAVFGFLAAVAWHHAELKQASDMPVILVALAGGVAGIIAQSDAHGLASHLLKWTRTLATIAAVLPLVATTYIAFQTVHPERVAPALWTAAALGGGIAVFLSVICLLSWVRQHTVVCSPWEQARARQDVPERPESFPAAAQHYHYDKPAVRVDSAEGWHTEFNWDQASEEQFTTALKRQCLGNHGPAPNPGATRRPISSMRRSRAADGHPDRVPLEPWRAEIAPENKATAAKS